MQMITAADFVDAMPPVPLARDEIHVWLYRDALPDSSTRILRDLLAAYLNLDPDDVGIDRDSRGKPHLARPVDASLQFNLSHSGGYLAVALGLRDALGVDIEASPRNRPWLALARRYFAKEEYRALSQLPQERLAAAFLQLWSCKEAVVKALGHGIAFGLDRVVFDLADDTGPGTLVGNLIPEGEFESADKWRIMQIRPAEGVAGALAWRGPEKLVRAFTRRVVLR